MILKLHLYNVIPRILITILRRLHFVRSLMINQGLFDLDSDD